MYAQQIKSYSRDQSGSIAIIFALVFLILVTVSGGAIDYGRYALARMKTAQAMDSAVLAAGRVLKLERGNTQKALAAAERYYAENKSDMLSQDNVEFSIEEGNVAVSIADARIKTPFLSIIGIEELRIRNVAKAVSAGGGNTGSHVEISMMLDITSSMAGGRLAAMQRAAKDLIDIVVWEDQSEVTSRVALVPFSEYVNVGHKYYEVITGKKPLAANDDGTCVLERSNQRRYSGKAPDRQAGYFDTFEMPFCVTMSPVMPLSSDKHALSDHIDRMVDLGATAGHLGVQFAWYMLDPRWAGVWGAQSSPLPYAMIRQKTASGDPKLFKIAVLLTDGAFNMSYSGPDAKTQALKFCDRMKKKGIIVYTVGFMIGHLAVASDMMQQCATSPDYYYDADDGEALRMAFRDIALQVSTLRLIR